MSSRVEKVAAEPFRVSAFAKARGRDGRLRPEVAERGLVDIVVDSGPGAGKGITLSWQGALDFARALRDPQYAPNAGTNPVVRVYHEERSVRVERGLAGQSQHWFALNGRPGVALDVAKRELSAFLAALSKRITAAARQAEQDIPAVSQRIAQDQAELARGGFPIGLTNDPRILDEARKIHDTDPKLRQWAQASRLQTSIALPVPSIKVGPASPVAALREQADTPEKQRELLRLLEEEIGG